MSMVENKNKPAFSIVDILNDVSESGVTKREYFAAKAMQGLRAAKLISSKGSAYHGDPSDKLWSSAAIAKCAVEDADALLKQLEEK